MIRKQIATFQGIDLPELEKEVNQWIKEEKIDVVDIKVNAWSPHGDQRVSEYYVITVIYSIEMAL